MTALRYPTKRPRQHSANFGSLSRSLSLGYIPATFPFERPVGTKPSDNVRTLGQSSTATSPVSRSGSLSISSIDINYANTSVLRAPKLDLLSFEVKYSDPSHATQHYKKTQDLLSQLIRETETLALLSESPPQANNSYLITTDTLEDSHSSVSFENTIPSMSFAPSLQSHSTSVVGNTSTQVASSFISAQTLRAGRSSLAIGTSLTEFGMSDKTVRAPFRIYTASHNASHDDDNTTLPDTNRRDPIANKPASTIMVDIHSPSPNDRTGSVSMDWQGADSDTEDEEEEVVTPNLECATFEGSISMSLVSEDEGRILFQDDDRIIY